jgi:hypothetical protein
MTSLKRVRREGAEAFGKLFHEYAARLSQSVRRTLRPATELGRLTRNKEASARISRRILSPY